MSKTLFIKTYGCQMNLYDSQRMYALLAPLGYAPVSTPDQANLVILNTCHIRDKASEKVFSELGRLRDLRQERREDQPLLIAVAGCVGQAEGEEIHKRAPWVDIVVGPQSYHALPRLLLERQKSQQPQCDISFPHLSKFDQLPEEGRRPGASAYLTIQEGCDKFCSFCVVPYTRGAEACRPPEAIIKEARNLIAGGARELVLLGQNVNAYRAAPSYGLAHYGLAHYGLAHLLEALNALPGLARLRYTTSHPVDMDDHLIAAHRDLACLMPALHLPVQSGSDRVLKAMGRRHNRRTYLHIVEKLRAARPDIALSSDFIVGFPGETSEDFAQTLDMITQIGFAQGYAFKYSPRPGTPAAEHSAQVNEEEKNQRLGELQALLTKQQTAFNRRHLGQTLPVLLERSGRHPGQLRGRTPYMQALHMRVHPEALGTIVMAKVIALGRHSLEGRLEGEAGNAATLPHQQKLPQKKFPQQRFQDLSLPQ